MESVPTLAASPLAMAGQESALANGQKLSYSWEACACLQFVRIFGPMLGLAPLARDALERSLAEPAADEGALLALQWRLLQPGTAPCPEGEGWYDEMRRVVALGVVQLEPALLQRVEHASYAELEPRERLLLLLALCNAAAPECDASEFPHLDNSVDEMRMAPIGTDGSKRAYFWFGDDECLFRECPGKLVWPGLDARSPATAKPASPRAAQPDGAAEPAASAPPQRAAQAVPAGYSWEVVATTSEEWRKLLTVSATGKGQAAAALRARLGEIVDEDIVRIEARKERLARQQEKQTAPRERLSARQQLREAERQSREAAEEEVAQQRREQLDERRQAEMAREEARRRKRAREDELILALRAEEEELERVRVAEVHALGELRNAWARADLEEATARALAAAAARGVQLTRTQLHERAQEQVEAMRALVRASAGAGSGAGERPEQPAEAEEREHAERADRAGAAQTDGEEEQRAGSGAWGCAAAGADQSEPGAAADPQLPLAAVAADGTGCAAAPDAPAQSPEPMQPQQPRPEADRSAGLAARPGPSPQLPSALPATAMPAQYP